MKASREQAKRNRAHAVEVASGLYREHGYDGIGIAAVLKAAGQTLVHFTASSRRNPIS